MGILKQDYSVGDQILAATLNANNKSATEGGALDDAINAGEAINGDTLPVPVYQDDSDNELYACDANDTGKLKFIGFAISNSADGNPIEFQGHGIISGFAGLAEGEKYYLQDAIGTIGITPGTYEVLIGVAISETQILIIKGKRVASGTANLSGSGSTTITPGFRISSLQIFAIDAAGSTLRQSTGNWSVYGGNRCVYSGDAAFGIDATKAWRVETTAGTATHIGLIDSITDISFDLTNVKTGGPANINIIWIATGEL